MNKLFTLSTGIALFITFLFIPVIVNAQEMQSAVINDQSENNQAVQFHIIGGLAASYCKPLFQQSQLRFTLDLALNSNTSDKDSKHTNSDTNSSYYIDTNSSVSGKEYSVDFVASYIYLLTLKKDVHPFLGLGIVTAYSKSTSSQNTNRSGTNSPISYEEYENNSSTLGMGLRGTLGCEAFITSSFSILAEYQISALHNWNDSNYLNKTTDTSSFDKNTSTSSSDGWQITLHSIRLGVAVHF